MWDQPSFLLLLIQSTIRFKLWGPFRPGLEEPPVYELGNESIERPWSKWLFSTSSVIITCGSSSAKGMLSSLHFWTVDDIFVFRIEGKASYNFLFTFTSKYATFNKIDRNLVVKFRHWQSGVFFWKLDFLNHTTLTSQW